MIVFTEILTKGKIMAALPATAAAASAANTQSLSNEGNEKTQSAEAIHKQLCDVALKVMSEMVADTKSRYEKFAKGQHSVLGQGVHTVESYYEKMKGIGKKGEPQLNFMRKEGHFYFGRAPKEFFRYVKDPSAPYGYSPMDYILKQGNPSDALTSLRTGFTFLGCGEGCQVAYYAALCDVLSKPKFDSLFHAKAPTPMSIGTANATNPINLLKTVVSFEGKPNELKRGQWTAVSVIDEYAAKHLCGDRGEYNVLCKEEGATPKFDGIDLPESVTQLQVTEALVAEFNRKPITDADIASEEVLKQIQGKPDYEDDLKAAASLKEKQITLAEYQSAGGGDLNEVIDFNMDRIMQLVKATPSQGKQLLKKWQEEVVKRAEEADEDTSNQTIKVGAPKQDPERDFVPAPTKSLTHTANF